jgi:hypothetical protein
MEKRGKKIAGFLFVVFLALFLWVGFKIKWDLGCLAYYEQCIANRIPGLTEKQCRQRGDMVAYLLETNICLVKSK